MRIYNLGGKTLFNDIILYVHVHNVPNVDNVDNVDKVQDFLNVLIHDVYNVHIDDILHNVHSVNIDHIVHDVYNVQMFDRPGVAGAVLQTAL